MFRLLFGLCAQDVAYTMEKKTTAYYDILPTHSYQPTPQTTRSARPRACSHDTHIPKVGQPNTTPQRHQLQLPQCMYREWVTHWLYSIRSCTQAPLFNIGMNISRHGSYTRNCLSDCEILIYRIESITMWELYKKLLLRL